MEKRKDLTGVIFCGARAIILEFPTGQAPAFGPKKGTIGDLRSVRLKSHSHCINLKSATDAIECYDVTGLILLFCGQGRSCALWCCKRPGAN